MSNGGSLIRIVAVLRTVPYLAAAAAFYRDALDFRVHEEVRQLGPQEAALLGVPGARVASLVMSLGRQLIGFLQFDPAGRPVPADGTASDLWFQHCAVVVADMDAAYRAISARPIAPVGTGGPQRLPPGAGGVRAFKFRDPFGHPLELLWFPPGTGDPVWQADAGGVFRGIDHTAIAVGAAEASTRFYEEVLGVTVTGRSLNSDAEQEKLDGIDHVAVDVVSLAPGEAPPHLELLGYRVGTRRPATNLGPADAAVTRTLAFVPDVAALVGKLDRHVPMHRGVWRSREAVTFSDPDGHRWICTAA